MKFNNVNIQSNRVYINNSAGAEYNVPTYTPGVTLNVVTNALVKNNLFSGGINSWADYPGFNIWRQNTGGTQPGDPLPSFNVVACQNTFGNNMPDSNGIGTIVPTSTDGAC